ncbi:hypothetical protein ASNO1_26220 [Corallococcus caeni]|uniref:Uncharacterized protein n=1 Tax=Corallococcus caeni TaxID=3082388 RepID=A0ABQ6QQS1_9BACT|nr:hypothetical protein ASNO1_26220 [Corallococcus sp. NO1]
MVSLLSSFALASHDTKRGASEVRRDDNRVATGHLERTLQHRPAVGNAGAPCLGDRGTPK